MNWIVALAGLMSLPLIVTDFVFLTEVLLGLARGRRTVAPVPSGRIALVVPAHNEAGVVRAAVARMAEVSPPGTRILVVAHNCSDATAEEARAGGAEVHALDEPERRGKGYALAGGRDALAGDPPDVAIVIDADCEPEPGAIARLAAAAMTGGRAVQATYLFRPRPDAGPVVQVSNFAMLVKNLVRQRGGHRIGAPALLTGSGMAFPWATFAAAELATGNIVEDLALGVDLVRAGRAPIFDEQAVIWSQPSSESGTGTQRARWEGGFLGTARAIGLPLVGHGLTHLRGREIWMGLHLLTLPLTLLLIANGGLLLLWAVLWLVGAPAMGVAAALLLLASLVAAVLAAWAFAGRAMLSAAMLARLPLYLLWKLALYARIRRGDETPAWIRTERID